jgi:hypothetical protein
MVRVAYNMVHARFNPGFSTQDPVQPRLMGTTYPEDNGSLTNALDGKNYFSPSLDLDT